MGTQIEIIGFHGTTKNAADSIMDHGFRPSRGKGDWLGDGAYFWQDAPDRAWEWALGEARKQNQPPVTIRARIKFRIGAPDQEEDLQYIDFLDISHETEVIDTYNALRAEYEETGWKLPRQTRKKHRVDRLVIERLVRDYRLRGERIAAVRAAFHQEGKPIYVIERKKGKHEESAIYTRSQVQIAVRDPEIISDLRIEREDLR